MYKDVHLWLYRVRQVAILGQKAPHAILYFGGLIRLIPSLHTRDNGEVIVVIKIGEAAGRVAGYHPYQSYQFPLLSHCSVVWEGADKRLPIVLCKNPRWPSGAFCPIWRPPWPHKSKPNRFRITDIFLQTYVTRFTILKLKSHITDFWLALHVKEQLNTFP